MAKSITHNVSEDIVFNSSKDLKEYISKLFTDALYDQSKLNKQLDRKASLVGAYCLEAHYNIAMIIGSGGDTIILTKRQAEYDKVSVGFSFLRDDGSTFDYSYKYAMGRKPNTEFSNFVYAARRSVQHEIFDQREIRFNDATHIHCEICGELITKNQAAMHHDEAKFRLITQAYTEINGIPATNYITGSYAVDFADEAQKRNFVEFHHQNAIIKYVCTRCNMAAERGQNHHSKDEWVKQ